MCKKKDTPMTTSASATDEILSANRGSDGVGMSVLRIIVLILCIISFLNTANGLKEFVFANTPAIAYAISFVAQSIIAVFALRREKIVNIASNSASSKLNVIILGVTIVAFIISVLFDYTFIVNSIYNVTKADDTQIGLTNEYTEEAQEVLQFIHTAYDEQYQEIVGSLSEIFPKTKELGKEGFTTEWSNYWNLSGNWGTENDFNNLNVDFKTAAEEAAKDDIKLTPEAKQNKLEILEKAEKLPIIEVFDTLRYVEKVALQTAPDALTSLNIDSIYMYIQEKEKYLEDIITTETYYQDKYNKAKITVNLETPEPYNIADIESNIDGTIFAKEAVEADIVQKQYDEERKNSYDKNKTDEQQSLDYQQLSWQYRIMGYKSQMGYRMSQSRIRYCRQGIGYLEQYQQYLQGIQSDSRFNINRLQNLITSTEYVSPEEIEDICSYISKSMISDKNNAISFADLKIQIARFIPLKNVYNLLMQRDFLEFEDENENDSVEVTQSPAPAGSDRPRLNDDKDTIIATKEPEEKSNFNVKKAKRQLDLLILNLSMLNESSFNSSKRPDSSGDPGPLASIEPTESLSPSESPNPTETAVPDNTRVMSVVKKFTDIEDRYLNNKNDVVKSFIYLCGNYDDNNHIGRKPALGALIFALLLDSLSIAIGFIVEMWEKGRKSTKIK